MSLKKITCSGCGYTREISEAALPKHPVNATCPKCKLVFVFDPAAALQMEQTIPVQLPSHSQTPILTPPYPQDSAREKVVLRKGLDAGANKSLFVLFLCLILVTVVFRLWADARYKAVPYPNLLAASAEGIAVSAGQTVYLYAPDGSLLQQYPLPADVQPTQLFWDSGTLCLADMRSKRVLRLPADGAQPLNFSGVRISAQFKVTREPATGRLFVSDGGGSRILIFDEKGTFQKAFGRAGTGPGGLRFPNELVFDETGLLLIANTKHPAIDLYTPDGQYKRTLITPSGDNTYRYPTDFVVTPDRLLALENDGFLENARVRVYDRHGAKVDEMRLGEVTLIGGFAADGQRLYLTDCADRKLLAFSLSGLRPLGDFSADFTARCAAWKKEAKLYEALSLGSLKVLFIFCAPVIILYLRIKKSESKELDRVSMPGVAGRKTGTAVTVPEDIILAPPVNSLQLKISIAMMVVGCLVVFLSMALVKLTNHPVFELRLAMVAGLLTLNVGIVLLAKSGGLSNLRRKQTEDCLKRLTRDGLLQLLPAEMVEKVALVKSGKSTKDLALLVFTDRRLLLYGLSWNKVRSIEQLPFEAITKVHRPVAKSLGVLNLMRVTMMVEGKCRDVSFYIPNGDLLLLLSEEFSQRIGKVSRLPYSRLCLTCLQPLQGDYCVTCATKLAPDRQAMLLSLFFPGLGQLKNGELQKGLVFVVVGVVSLLVGYVGIRGWFFEGADLTLKQKVHLGTLVVMAPLWYTVNVVDAYRSSMKGRKVGGA